MRNVVWIPDIQVNCAAGNLAQIVITIFLKRNIVPWKYGRPKLRLGRVVSL